MKAHSISDHGNLRRGRMPRWGGAVAAILLIVPLTGLAADGDNLLPNASFEQLDTETARPEGWSAWAKPNYAVYTLAAARTGVSCVAVTDDDPKVSQGLRSPRVAIEPGGTYRASAWLKVERVTQGSFAIYLEYWAGGTRIANKAVGTAEAPDWRELTLAYPAPEAATEATVLVYGSSATVGRAYFDDASLVRIAEP